MQRNQRPPPIVGGMGGNVPPNNWHPQTQGSRDGSSSGSGPMPKNYPGHPMSHPHQGGRGILGMAPPLHTMPRSSHPVPLLPTPQGYPPPSAQGMQATPSMPYTDHDSGGPQNFSAPPQPPQQIQQVNLGDIATAATSLADIAPRVQSLGFPASSRFVIGLLERFFNSQLESGEDMPSGTLKLVRDNLVGLIDMFVLCQTQSLAGGDRGTDKPTFSLNPVEEMQLLLTIQTQLEEQKNVKLRYCVFDAIFGGITCGTTDSGCRFALVQKLVSLCISTESKGVLLCAALWMSAHHKRALSMAESLFHEFSVLLPDGMEPLLHLVSHSSHLAHQMAAAFTTMHPFHVVGKLVPGVNTSNLHPPIKMLHLMSHWVESSPEFFFSSHHPDITPSKLPLLHSHSTNADFQILRSPITGIIQWCVLAPMVNDSKFYSDTTTKIGSKNNDDDFQHLLAQLHAEVLSALLTLSQSQVFSRSNAISSLNSDDVAMIVAALIGFNQKQEVGGAEGGGRSGQKVVGGRGGGGGRREKELTEGSKMEECVERFAQFLQISLSVKVLQLKSDDMNSIASTLPKNRLLELVISHCKNQLSTS